MNTPDISALLRGVLAIVMLAIAIGQYPRLERWARSRAVEALEWKEGLPYFFAQPQPAGRRSGSAHRLHSQGRAAR
jgi:hypothetical protein